MITSILNGNQIQFDFTDFYPGASFYLDFHRTLRIPDDGKKYDLPPSLGRYPLEETSKYQDRLSPEVARKGGVFFPMWSSEATWINFHKTYPQGRQGYVFAIRISAGKKNALTGEDWSETLKEGEYMVSSLQPWLDGFVVDKGVIRQFIAASLGSGLTVEGQLNPGGEEKEGGIQIEVFPMKKEEYEKRFPPYQKTITTRSLAPQSASFEAANYSIVMCSDAGGAPSASLESISFNSMDPTLYRDDEGPIAVAATVQVNSMGLAAGGTMKQDVHDDPYGVDVWDTSAGLRTWVHLFDVDSYAQLTGKQPPDSTANEALYKSEGYKWYDYYCASKAVEAKPKLKGIKSAAQIQKEKGEGILPPSEIQPEPEKPLVKEGISQGEW